MSSATIERSSKGRAATEIAEITPQLFQGPNRERVSVLLLGGDQPALRALYATLRVRAKVTLAEDLPAALEKLAQQDINVIFCAACFHCGSWVEALQTIGFLHPAIPVVVVNEAPQNQTFAERQTEMYAAGAFDVLDNAQDELGVLVVLAHALATGEARQWQAAS